MSALTIAARVEKTFQEELQGRVPDLVVHVKHENPEGEPPYAVLQADEARETTPGSGVYYTRLALLVTHAIDEDPGVEHAACVQRVRLALESMPRPAVDEANGLRLYGFTIDRVVSSDVEQEQGSLFEMNVGCGVIEKQEGGPVNTPQVELEDL